MNYKIKCHNTNRGFFSDLLHSILPSVIYLTDNGKKNFNIDWRNSIYQSNDFNLYNYFFDFNEEFESYDEILTIDNCPYGIFFSLHNSKEQLIRGSKCLKDLKLTQSTYFKNIIIPFELDKKVLGVQQRKTDHSDIVNIIDDDDLIKKTDQFCEKNNYDEIFFITDCQQSLRKFKSFFGDKIKYTDSFRSENHTAVHKFSNYNFDRIELAKQVLNDSYLLSLTNYKIICNSNVSTFALLNSKEIDSYEYVS